MIVFAVFAFTLAAYCLMACAYIGLGRLAFAPLLNKFALKDSLFPSLWLGWSASLLFLHLWNFFAPVSGYAAILLYGAGALAFLTFARTRRRELRAAAPSAISALILFLAALWLAARAMLGVTTWDSGLYHLNSIRWLNEYAVVPGLANLHGRLAFNQAFFAYAAALNFYPWFNHGNTLANSFLLLTVFAELLFGAENVLRGKGTGADSAAAFLLPALVYVAATEEVAAPSPNLASALLQILLFVSFARQMEERRDERLGFMLILSAAAVTVKLNNLFFAAAVSLLLVGLKLWEEKSAWREALRALAYPVAVALLMLLVWSARGIVLSGCPAYPSTAGCLKLPWSAPMEKVVEEAQRTYRFARYHLEKGEKPLDSWQWLPAWFHRVVWGNKTSVLYPSLAFLFGAAALAAFAQKAKRRLWLPLPGLTAILLWFFVAPDLRFAYALFWILPVSVFYALLKTFETSPRAPALRRMFFLAANASVLFFFLQNPQVFGKISLRGYQPFQTAELIRMTTESGLQVWTPESPIGRCWDAPLPCAQEFNPKLRLLGEDLQSGFALDP